MQFCTTDDYDLPAPPSTSDYHEAKLINIALVRRGQCSFSRKVRVAMEKGAHAVVIVDKEDSKYTDADMANIIVAEDGTAQDIHIPSVFISKERGRDLIAAAEISQVIIELAWDLPTNHVVATDLWMSSASRESMKFLKEFTKNRRTLNEVLMFTPHYAIFGMDTSSSAAESVQALCSDSSGRYCAEDPDGDGPITGKAVIEEDLRQLCLHQLTKVERPFYADLTTSAATRPVYSKEFWDYIEIFSDACPLDGRTPEHQFGKPCSERLLTKVGVDVNRIDQCVVDSKEQKLKEQRDNTAWSPRALRINGWRYSGILDVDLVTRAICSGFVSTPAECKAILHPRNPFRFYSTVKPGISISELIGTLSMVIACLASAMWLYMRYQRKQMQFQIREEVMLEVEAAMGEYGKLRG
jgi:hypothetical protein